MRRRPPRSTLFPYTRSSDLVARRAVHGAAENAAVTSPDLQRVRSEEHTSELQSRRDIVCRLLLEKKKLRRLPRNPLIQRSRCPSGGRLDLESHLLHTANFMI